MSACGIFGRICLAAFIIGMIILIAILVVYLASDRFTTDYENCRNTAITGGIITGVGLVFGIATFMLCSGGNEKKYIRQQLAEHKSELELGLDPLT